MQPQQYEKIAIVLHGVLLACGIVMMGLEFLPVEAPVHELLLLL